MMTISCWFPFAALGFGILYSTSGAPPEEFTKCISHHPTSDESLPNSYCYTAEELRSGDWVRIRVPLFEADIDEMEEEGSVGIIQFGYMSKNGKKDWKIDAARIPTKPFWIPHGENVTYPLTYARLLRIAQIPIDKVISITLVNHYVRANKVVQHYSKVENISYHTDFENNYLEIILMCRNSTDLELYVQGKRVERIALPEFYPDGQFLPISYRMPTPLADATKLYKKGINFIEYVRNKKRELEDAHALDTEIVVFRMMSVPTPYPVALLPGGLLYDDRIEIIGYLFETVEIRLVTKLNNRTKWTLKIQKNGKIELHGMLCTKKYDPPETFDKFPRVLSTITIVRTTFGLIMAVNAKTDLTENNAGYYNHMCRFSITWDAAIKYVELREGYKAKDVQNRNLFIFAHIPRINNSPDPIFI